MSIPKNNYTYPTTNFIDRVCTPLMNFADVAEMFRVLESTEARLEMTSVIVNFLKTVPRDELRDVIYIIQGKLHPDFYQVEFGMADKLVLKAISLTTGVPYEVIENTWTKIGDSGEVAEKLIKEKKQITLFSETLSVARVVKNLKLIEICEGKESQMLKTKYLASMLHDSGPIEAKYLCRIVTGKMRTGASIMTILDAIAITFATKEERSEIERAFNITCDSGLVAETLAKNGMRGIRAISVRIGNPIKVMLAERLSSLSEIIEKMGGTCAVEYKYDGIRAQIHISGNYVKIFSRRLEDLTDNFPDIAKSLISHFRGKEVIVEGECVAISAKTGHIQSFQDIAHRRRKYNINETIKDIPVRIFLFDMLYLDGIDLTSKPYFERRKLIEEWFNIAGIVQMSCMKIIHSTEEAERFFNDAIKERCEGIIAKSTKNESVYRAGSRGFLWIKYKKDYCGNFIDSFDLVVVGAFYGMGRRAGKYGALLMASYDSKSGRYGTVCKLGTGFDDNFLDNLPNLLNEYKSNEKPHLLDAKIIPDIWFQPGIVLEVVGAEVTISPNHAAGMNVIKEGSGIGIRFPRFTGRVRYDKEPEQSTTVSEMIKMYNMQFTDFDLTT
ncbi:MAG: ATP-dependent DNA ligase [archaeon]|nr:ATP-dependent DNA ligase [archaeon]